MQFLLVANGNHLNRGCEAITRGTARILRTTFGEETVCVNAYNERMGQSAPRPPALPGVIDRPLKSPGGIAGRCRDRAQKLAPGLLRPLYYAPLRAPLRDSAAALSLGGDNFSLDYGVPVRHLEQNRFIRSQGKPVIIWGASVGPFDDAPAAVVDWLHRRLREDVTAIFAREAETVDYLTRHGLGDRVRQVCDPAFVMEPEPPDEGAFDFALPAGAIGLNLSPLIAERVAATMEERYRWAAAVIDALRRHCRRPVVLIPHVTLPWADDHRFMAAARDRCDATEEIYLLPPTLNAARTKHVIARMDCLVAARTHATIAAFSTGVPTVSLAYSVKAVGLNRQIFGHTDYLIGGRRMDPEAIAKLAGRLLADKERVTADLTALRPVLHQQAFQAGRYLKELLAGAV